MIIEKHTTHEINDPDIHNNVLLLLRIAEAF